MSPRGYVPGKNPEPDATGCWPLLALAGFLMGAAWWGTLIIAQLTHSHVHLP